MPKSPDVPDGLNVAEFGFKVMRWGTGDAAARERMDALTRSELVTLGVTGTIARTWRDFYLSEIIRNPKNPSARGRADLMQRALELLEQTND